jgi:hypothetical protein
MTAADQVRDERAQTGVIGTRALPDGGYLLRLATTYTGPRMGNGVAFAGGLAVQYPGQLARPLA